MNVTNKKAAPPAEGATNKTDREPTRRRGAAQARCGFCLAVAVVVASLIVSWWAR